MQSGRHMRFAFGARPTVALAMKVEPASASVAGD
jgi:hypothetical protein